jgi:hypothetical protein
MKDPAPPFLLEPLTDLPPGSPIETEWNLFRRELPRLLAEGHEGRWVLIKGDEIIGLFDSRREAMSVGTIRFGLTPMLAEQILRWYRPVRAGNGWRRLGRRVDRERIIDPGHSGAPLGIAQ